MEKYLNKEIIQQHKKQIIQIGAAVLIIIVAIAVYAAGHSDQKDDIDIAQNNNEAQVNHQSHHRRCQQACSRGYQIYNYKLH